MAYDKSPTGSVTDVKVSTDVAVFASNELKALDVALALVRDQNDDASAEPVPPAESARLLRKIDWHLVPLLLLVNTGTSLHPFVSRFIYTKNPTVQFIDK